MNEDVVAGFELYLKHKGVVINAVARLTIPRSATNWEDFVHDGMLVYVQYYVHYRDPLNDDQAVAKFNRLAGKFVYLTLLRQLLQAKRHAEIEAQAVRLDQPVQVVEDQMTAVQSRELFSQLYARLTPHEREVLILKYYDQLSDAEVARRTHMSASRVRTLRNYIVVKYLQVAS